MNHDSRQIKIWVNCSLRHDKLVAGLLLAVLSAIFFFPVLFGGDTLLGRDFSTIFYGAKSFYRESILNGDFPLWCPQMLSGMPFVACSQHSPLYPFSLIWVIFPTAYAYAIYGTVHHWMFAWFSYLLAKECRAGIAGALLAACIAFACSTMLQFQECPELFGGPAWLPLILYFWFGLLRGGGWGKVVGLAVAGAMQVSAGSPYPLLMTLVSLLVAGVPFWLLSKQRASLPTVILRGAASFAVAFLLAAPHLLPTLELTRQISSEFLSRDAQSQIFYSLLPQDWLKTLCPLLYGYPMQSTYLYLGVLPVILGGAAIAAMFARRWHWSGSAVGMAALAVAGIVMASGPLINLHHLLARVPMISRLYSYPQYYNMLVALSVPILAGLALRPLRRLSRKALLWLSGLSLGMALALFIATPWVSQWADTMRQLPRYLNDFKSFTAQPDAFPMSQVVFRFLILWVCSLGVTLLLTSKRRQLLAPAMLSAIVLLVIDKSLLVGDLRLFGKTNVYEVVPPSAQALIQAGANRELARWHRTYHMMGETHILSGSNDPREFAWIRTFMPWSVGLTWGFSQTTVACTLSIPEAERIWAPFLDRFEPWQNDRLRGLWNAKWIMDVKRDERGYSYQLRENPQFMPRVWLSAKVMVVRDWKDALQLLLDKNFDPKGTALVYAPAEMPPNLLEQRTGYAPAQSVVQTNNTITIKASSACDTVLVVADTYYKWWRAEIDGKPTPVLKVNMAQKGVLFPAGDHVVRLVCVPISFYAGCGLFVIGIPLIIFLLWLDRREKLLHDNTVGSVENEHLQSNSPKADRKEGPA